MRTELLQQQEIPAFRVGSRANVVVVTDKAGFVLGRAWLWVVSIADYVF